VPVLCYNNHISGNPAAGILTMKVIIMTMRLMSERFGWTVPIRFSKPVDETLLEVETWCKYQHAQLKKADKALANADGDTNVDYINGYIQKVSEAYQDQLDIYVERVNEIILANGGRVPAGICRSVNISQKARTALFSK
jgi:hypothetical protein